jgi:DNA-binding transcriptional ArsR family regulator
LTVQRIKAKIRFMARPHNAPDPFRAIAHPVRRRMLEMLRKSSLTAAELGQPFHLTQGTISDHIRALRVAGLISFEARKNQNVYSLVRTRLTPLEEWLGTLRRA